MKIALFSYEFPPETGSGGIGTYLKLTQQLLNDAGHLAIVFTATNKSDAFWETETIFKIPAKDWDNFNIRLPKYFLPIHNKINFDVAEGTDFKGCGLSIKKALPQLPLAVRLHTPLFLVDQLLYKPLTIFERMRFVLGGLLKGKINRIPGPPAKEQYADEFEICNRADYISSPGKSIAQKLIEKGFKLTDKTGIVPLPFLVTPQLKAISARQQTNQRTNIVFIGRMELRKGVIDLAKAIPLILQTYPETSFTFVGKPSVSPVKGQDMLVYLKELLSDYLDKVKFTGQVPPEEIIDYLSKGDIFVFPSHYESFGFVCCEAMAAGKAVIGSENGGMAELIDDGISGLLVEPKAPLELSEKVKQLIAADTLRVTLGTNARNAIIEKLSPEKIIPLQVALYHKAISHCSKK
jgi:glycosyltransferase involved in cell wall biosynthesis